MLLILALPLHAAELEGVSLDERVRVDGQELQLNGIALRTRYSFVKVYVAGLYLPQRATAAREVIDGRGARRIVLVMIREASAEQFVESIAAGLRANHSEADLARVLRPTEELFAKIRAIGEARKGMRIVLDYVPSAGGTTLIVDDKPQGDAMRGAEFYRALLRIWLGDNPAQLDLKEALLGQPADSQGAQNDY